MAKQYFTFKTIKPTGKWKSFESPEYQIKFNKTQVGIFVESEEKFFIHLMVVKNQVDLAKPKNNPNRSWKWIQLKQNFSTLKLAKKFVLTKITEEVEKGQIQLYISQE